MDVPPSVDARKTVPSIFKNKRESCSFEKKEIKKMTRLQTFKLSAII